MASSDFGTVLRRWLQSLDGSAKSEASDGQLLERFIQQRDEMAFAALVRRHGPLVLGVCRKELRNDSDADDAFQATFLVLACRAASIRRRESVASFLYGVATRIARHVKEQNARRSVLHRRAASERPEAFLPSDNDGETHSLLHEELNLLPSKYRDVLILCYLQGKTSEEAARELGHPVGSMSRHLSRARELLRQRLSARGVGTGVLATVWTAERVSAALVYGTLDTIRRHALASALMAGASPPMAVVLAQGILRTAWLTRTTVASLVLTLSLVFAGGMAAFHTTEGKETTTATNQPTELPEPIQREPALDRYGDPLPEGALFRFGSVRMRHAGAIHNSALSPDGKILATASRGSVILWDLAKEKPLRRLHCDDSDTFSLPGLVFSPNGKYLSYVQDSYAAYLWDVNTGKEIARFPRDHNHRHGLCQFTPDSEQLILSDGPKRVSFWQVQANKESRCLALEDVTLLSPDTRYCVRIEPEGGITFLDARSGKKADPLKVMVSYNGNGNRIAFSPDSKSLAVAHQKNKEIQIRSFPSGELRATFPLPDSTKYRVGDRDYWDYRLSFSTDGRTLLLGTKAGVVHRWDLAGRKEMPLLSKHFGEVTSAHLLPDGKTMVTTGEDGLIRRWEHRTGRQLSEPPGYAGRTYSAYSPDGRLVAVGDARGRLELWDAGSGRLHRVLRRDGLATIKLAFTPNGESLAEARADGAIHFWAVPSGEPQSVLHCKGQNFRHLWSLRVSPDGRRVLVADVDYRACLWDRTSGEQLWSKRFGPCAFSQDGKSVVIADGPYLHFLDSANGKNLTKVRLNTDTPDGLGVINTIACSPDGQRLAVGMCFGTVYLCEALTGAEIAHFQAADAPKGPTFDPGRERFGLNVRGLSFSLDSRWLSTSGSDGSVRLWEVATGREVLRRNGHLEKAIEVAFGADSRTVLSCGEDAQCYLWTLRPSEKREANRSLDALWSALVGEPAKAYRAIWTMTETKDALDFLRGMLSPVKPLSHEHLRRLLTDLDSELFAVRQKAQEELEKLGDLAEPALRKALEDKPTLEVRKRVQALLERLRGPVTKPELLRSLRSVAVLEDIGTPEARRILEEVGKGAPEARLTREAKAALQRLNARKLARD